MMRDPQALDLDSLFKVSVMLPGQGFWRFLVGKGSRSSLGKGFRVFWVF